MANKKEQLISWHMARFALDLTWSTLPAEVQTESSRAMLNWVGCAVGGAQTATMSAAVNGIRGMDEASTSPLLGRSERTSMANAALLNCLSSAAHTFDDTHLPTITHPTGPVAAAVLVAAHRLAESGKPVSGSAALAALIVGMELECRVSEAIASGASQIGWYMTGLSGGIGAAVAVGRLLGLSCEQMVSAIGLAAAQACGLRATHGSMAIAYIPAVASRNGLASAYMAAADFTGSDILIDGRNGLLEVISSGADAQLIVTNLGAEYEFLNNAYKPYPCGIVIHPAIDACLELAHNGGISHRDIESITLQVHPDAMTLTWRKLPHTVLDAQVSLYHWIAAALVYKSATLEQGTLDCIMNHDVRALQEKIRVDIKPELADNQACAVVNLRNGSRFEAKIESATGSTTNPMSTEQLIAKFQALTQAHLGTERTSNLIDFCLSMPKQKDTAKIFHLGAV